jgi:hypothetical protein
MKAWPWIRLILALIALIYLVWTIFGFYHTDVEVRLTNVVSEDNKHAWEFFINGKEISAGEKVTVSFNFTISLKEFCSREITDKKNIADLIQSKDIIIYRYFSPTSEDGERIIVEIQHKDGSITLVPLKIY